MPGLWINEEGVREGKYLVLRRDGTVPDWPWFVLGARDPVTPFALRCYAVAALVALWDWRYARDVWRLAGRFKRFRREHGSGDPPATRHRQDDPDTVAMMRRATLGE
jgi:hypothetical protein